MYEFMRGRVHSLLPGLVVLDVGGVGYRLQVPISTSSAITGEEALLLVHHTINAEQGEERLYGFYTPMERQLFRSLITVKGIGPSTAISILCASAPDAIVDHIANGDVSALRRFKGIGPKSAERIVAELKDQVGALRPTTSAPRAAPLSEDAVKALVALAYSQAKAEQAVAKAAKKLGTNAGTEELVRQALQLV